MLVEFRRTMEVQRAVLEPEQVARCRRRVPDGPGLDPARIARERRQRRVRDRRIVRAHLRPQVAVRARGVERVARERRQRLQRHGSLRRELRAVEQRRPEPERDRQPSGRVLAHQRVGGRRPGAQARRGIVAGEIEARQPQVLLLAGGDSRLVAAVGAAGGRLGRADDERHAPCTLEERHPGLDADLDQPRA